MSEKTGDKKVALVVGAGDAIGSAIAKAFAQKGFTVCMARRTAESVLAYAEQMRSEGFDAHGFQLDARNEEQVEHLFNHIEQEIGLLDVVVFNIGANVPMSLFDTSSRKFMKIWEMACFSGFLVGREAARKMVARKRGTILFTGATASLRGGRFSALLPVQNTPCVVLCRVWRENWGQRIFTLRMSLSMPLWIPNGFRRTIRIMIN